MQNPAPRLPTDDWPFLYLASPHIPTHYRIFMGLIVLSGFLPLCALPAGQRKVRFPYFFLGAAFFLIETSNVVSLALLYGSTWIVNVVVFAGILFLVLLGNLTSLRFGAINRNLIFAALGASVVVAYVSPPSFFLGIGSEIAKAVGAVLIFLGPVYFASLLFARLIRNEANLYQAYGSNILGAAVGGAFEYFSIVFGFKALLGITLAFYLLAFLFLGSRSQAAAAPTSGPCSS
jgi:hypothetical protein